MLSRRRLTCVTVVVILALSWGWGYLHPVRSPGRPFRLSAWQRMGSIFGPSWTYRSRGGSEPVRGRETEHVRSAIEKSARSHGIHPDLLRAVIWVESGFNPGAVSPAGARGLMQLMPATAREVGVIDVFSPAHNIDGGARYLRYLLDRYNGNLSLALAAYNAGPGAVDSFRGIPRYRETRQYVNRVLAVYRYFRGS